MIFSPLLVLFRVISKAVQMQRQARHRLSQEPNAGVDRGDLHGGFFIHLLTGIRFAEDKGLPGVPDAVSHGGSVARTNAEPFKKSHVEILPLK